MPCCCFNNPLRSSRVVGASSPQVATQPPGNPQSMSSSADTGNPSTATTRVSAVATEAFPSTKDEEGGKAATPVQKQAPAPPSEAPAHPHQIVPPPTPAVTPKVPVPPQPKTLLSKGGPREVKEDGEIRPIADEMEARRRKRTAGNELSLPETIKELEEEDGDEENKEAERKNVAVKFAPRSPSYAIAPGPSSTSASSSTPLAQGTVTSLSLSSIDLDGDGSTRLVDRVAQTLFSSFIQNVFLEALKREKHPPDQRIGKFTVTSISESLLLEVFASQEAFAGDKPSDISNAFVGYMGDKEREEEFLNLVAAGESRGIVGFLKAGFLDFPGRLELLTKEVQRKLETSLMIACREGLTFVLKAVVEGGKKEYLKQAGWSGTTPLHSAALEGQEDTVRFLCEQLTGEEILVTGGFTPKSAIEYAADAKHYGTLEVLLASVQLQHLFKREGSDLSVVEKISLLDDPEIMRTLMNRVLSAEEGLDFDAAHTSLHLDGSTLKGTELARCFLLVKAKDAGAKFEIIRDRLALGAHLGMQGYVGFYLEYLKENSIPGLDIEFIKERLKEACLPGNKGCVKLYIGYLKSNPSLVLDVSFINERLQEGLRSGNFEHVDLYLEYLGTSSIPEQDKNKLAAYILFLCVHYRNLRMLNTITTYIPSVGQVIYRDLGGDSAFHLAARMDEFAMIKILAEVGGKEQLLVENRQSKTPLELAFQCDNSKTFFVILDLVDDDIKIYRKAYIRRAKKEKKTKIARAFEEQRKGPLAWRKGEWSLHPKEK